MSILTDIFDVTENAISGKRKRETNQDKVVVVKEGEPAPSPEKSSSIA